MTAKIASSAQPAISVLMPVHNGAEYVALAVQSILDQTFTDFELIIVDDGSTDESPKILRSFTDPRIRVIVNEQNLGVTKTLNRGLRQARGAYTARMDSDDIALPQRLAVQKAFLDEHPDITVVGSSTIIIDSAGAVTGLKRALTDPELIRWRMVTGNQVAHPSVMFRTAAILAEGGYDESIRQVQDFRLWSHLLARGYTIANIADALIRYRFHQKSVTQGAGTKKTSHSLSLDTVRANISRYAPVSDAAFAIYVACFYDHMVASFADVAVAQGIISALEKSYIEKEKPSPATERYIRAYAAAERKRAVQWYVKSRFKLPYKIGAWFHRILP